ncbi:uncharacterized protein Z518_01761 [Rhinocladiella mackenziei CBS 650.93]|uniref:Altered inheritance of mitochondria protein 6 n=1 Tax=Rhinocladiella mackenziei CBS 650.93 TaxID=1442369 RepID=A0A0D2G6T4_9EURO|nr:uncharacterized protein Z518_01761 [Rhinocladiella mackenziei CBS 650.93]KIX10677.1 hypothetical protein Z518_01761 [Rhinocladiella mackenziei CBS 650.93]
MPGGVEDVREDTGLLTLTKSGIVRRLTRPRLWVLLGALLCFGAFSSMCWFFLVLWLRQRLSPAFPNSGYGQILEQWKAPSPKGPWLPTLPQELGGDIIPVPCHSHNDYWRPVPLYGALAVGYTSVEADIWLDSDTNRSSDLLVGHSRGALTPECTLSSLYITPLVQILDHQNEGQDAVAPRVGVYNLEPNATLVLLLDFKERGADLWELAHEQTEPLRQKGYLRHWNGTDLVPGPITIVASGEAAFDLVVSNTTYRDIFFDAPLEKLVVDDRYNWTNSYYASSSLARAVGTPWLGRLSTSQRSTVELQVQAARQRGLLARYWGTPSWPVSTRTAMWRTLVSLGVGVLNVDDLIPAGLWNWDWCVVAGVSLCG